MAQRFYSPCARNSEVIEVLDRALRRFPRDSRLLLARLLTTPGAFAVSNRPGVAADRLAKGLLCHGWLLTPGSQPRGLARTIPLTREGFRALASDPVVGDEASARLALLEYMLGDVDASLADVAGATGSADPFVRNLAGVVAGLAWDAKGQPDRALAAYRTAVEAMPRSTAAVAFATHAFLAGQRAVAEAALAEALPPRVFVFDPWDGPLAGDRFLAQYLADLRTMLGLAPREFLAPPSTGGFGPDSMGLIAPPVGRAAPIPAVPTNIQAVVPAATASSPVPANPRTFRSTATTVLVDASVKLNRRPVTGLTLADFELLDNGVPQTVEALSIESIPLDVTFVVDTRDSLHSDVPPNVRANNPLAAALSRVEDVARALRPDDRVRVIEANVHAVELRPWTSVVDLSGRPVKPSYEYGIGWGTSAICDATAAALIHPVPTNRRSLVIVLTIGLDGVSLTTPAQLGRVAQQSDGTIIMVRHETKNEADARRIMELRRARGLSLSVPPDRDNESMLWPKDIEGLSRLVRDSGGYVFEVRDGTTSADPIREVLADFAQRYLLRYSVQGVSPDGWHAITVKVKRPGNHTVVARRGYFGG
jgi:VWFA-related protein